MQKDWLQKGVKAALPVVMGYFPIGMAFGVLAVSAGLNVWEVMFMSFFVYAGSSQFIAVGMISIGASFGAIVFTTFLVNARHILFSASLAPYVKKYKTWVLALMSYGITDETYGVAINNIDNTERDSAYYFGLFWTSQLTWVISTVLGAAVGNLIPDPQVFGLQFALPAMFIGLLVMQMKDKMSVIIAIIAVILSLSIKIYFPGNWNVILASVITATIGVMMEKWTTSLSKSSSV